MSACLTGLSRAFFEAPPDGFHRNAADARRARDVPGAAGPAAGVAGAARRGHRPARDDGGRGAGDGAGAAPGLRGRGGDRGRRVRHGRGGAASGISAPAPRAAAARWRCAAGPGGSSAAAGCGMSRSPGGAVFRAPVVVNAAGAWGDEVAAHAGVRRSGLQPEAPHRRDHRPGALGRHRLADDLRCRATPGISAPRRAPG